MITRRTAEAIKKIGDKYPESVSAVMPALRLVQIENNNSISSGDIQEIASALNIPVGKVRGTASFYSMYNIDKAVGKYHLKVDTNIPATLMGALEILSFLEKKLEITAGETTADGLFTLSTVEDLASGGTCPVIQVNDLYYENMTEDKSGRLIDALKSGTMPEQENHGHFKTVCNVLLKNRGEKNAAAIKNYKQGGGYRAAQKAREMPPEMIIQAVKDSGIRGRGGAGFPTGTKWEGIPKEHTGPVYLICNADEGEPGTFKDRQIMEYDPHLLIEGMIIAARAVGAKLGFIYIRGEFNWIAKILESAIEEARADRQMTDLDIIVHQGAGSYTCGEETALIESLEGNRGQPRKKPPFPAVSGLYGAPTIINNVETLASIPFIVEHGADEFKKWGFKDNYGFKLFAVSGHVNKPGVFEYPIGTSFTELISAAGGVKQKLKGAIVGGLSTPILTAGELSDLNLDYESCKKHGTSLGARGIMVINDTVSIPELALRTAEFYAHESCGNCTPCREGAANICVMLKKIVTGTGQKDDLEKVIYLTSSIKDITLCPVGGAISSAIGSMINKFREEFDACIK